MMFWVTGCKTSWSTSMPIFAHLGHLEKYRCLRLILDPDPWGVKKRVPCDPIVSTHVIQEDQKVLPGVAGPVQNDPLRGGVRSVGLKRR